VVDFSDGVAGEAVSQDHCLKAAAGESNVKHR
jgi:hypothetical protein